MLAVHPSPDGRSGIQGRRVAVTGIGVVAPCGVGRERLLRGPAFLGPALRGASTRRRLRRHAHLWPEGDTARRPLHPIRGVGRGRGPRRRRRSRWAGRAERRPGSNRGHHRHRDRRGSKPSKTSSQVLRDKGPRRGQPFPRADDDGEPGRRGRVDALRFPGALRSHRHGLRGFEAPTASEPKRPLGRHGPLRCGLRRIGRGRHDRDRHRRLQQHDRALSTSGLVDALSMPGATVS